MRQKVELTALELCEKLLAGEKVYFHESESYYHAMDENNSFFAMGADDVRIRASIIHGGTYYLDFKWYEQEIPECGVLVKYINGHIKRLTQEGIDNPEVSDVLNCKPLTEAEIRAFLPTGKDWRVGLSKGNPVKCYVSDVSERDAMSKPLVIYNVTGQLEDIDYCFETAGGLWKYAVPVDENLRTK